MGISRREWLTIGAAPAALGLIAKTAGATQQEAPPTLAETEDPVLAACLLIAGRKQIEVCRFALDRVQNDEVKDFAKLEIEEHETVRTKLHDRGFDYPGSPVSPAEANSPAGRRAARVMVIGRVVLAPGAAEVIHLEHEVASQCITTAKTELAKLSGLKLDKRFIGAQLDAHYGLLDRVLVFKKHATREMIPLIEESLGVIDKHITRCKEIMEKLETEKS